MTKARHTANLVDANGDIQSSALDNVPNEVTVSASAPGSPSEGDLWYDTNGEELKVYSSSNSQFVKVSRIIPRIDSIAGAIVNGATSNLTLTGAGFLTSNLIVSFTPSGGSATNVTVTPASDTSAVVAVPSAIYGLSTSTVVAIQVKNSDLKDSNSINETVVDLPTGGTISNSGGYRIHTFTSSGTFANTLNSLSVDYLVIAGGAGGGGAGGGGAGGLLTGTSTLSATNHTVTIGGGGAGATTGDGTRGSNGTNTSFGSVATTIGGGGGGGYTGSNEDGLAGGSGGGGGYAQGTGGAGTAGQGYRGGNTVDSTQTPFNCSGGGGAGAIGNSDSGSTSGTGGIGLQSSINGTNLYWAGGGGGGAQGSTSTSGNGGLGGGGGGANYSGGTPGTGGGSALNTGGNGVESSSNALGGAGGANTGGGGGGMGISVHNGGAGGSGIVIVRYVV